MDAELASWLAAGQHFDYLGFDISIASRAVDLRYC